MLAHTKHSAFTIDNQRDIWAHCGSNSVINHAFEDKFSSSGHRPDPNSRAADFLNHVFIFIQVIRMNHRVTIS